MLKDMELQKRICDAADELKAEYVQTLQNLVRIPSLAGDEAEAQRFMADLYASAGLDVIQFEARVDKIRSHPAFIDTGKSYHNRPNVIGILKGNPNSNSLILNGHIDVVPPDPEDAWSQDPWGGHIEGTKLFGRGAGDMKSGLLANLFAVKCIQKAGLRPIGSIMLQSVVDEEAGGAGGTLACLVEGYTADALICTEPHNLNITISHAGINYFRVTVQGRSAHAGLAHMGVNAIGKMYAIYRALEELDQKRGVEISFPLFAKGSGRATHLNIGTMRAGEWPSTVPGDAVIECRIGYVPGETIQDIKALIERTVQQAAAGDAWLRENPPKVEWFGWQAEPWYQDPEHPFVQMFLKSAADIVSRNVEIIGRASGNDARFSQYFNMAGACTGPQAGNIHGIDEFVEIPSAVDVIKVLALTALRWCGYQP
jgi:acetylornithine deacetylase